MFARGGAPGGAGADVGDVSAAATGNVGRREVESRKGVGWSVRAPALHDGDRAAGRLDEPDKAVQPHLPAGRTWYDGGKHEGQADLQAVAVTLADTMQRGTPIEDGFSAFGLSIPATVGRTETGQNRTWFR